MLKQDYIEVRTTYKLQINLKYKTHLHTQILHRSAWYPSTKTIVTYKRNEIVSFPSI